MVGDISILNAAKKQQLFAIQQTAQGIDAATVKLASGKKVNSALDNPQNFFTARALDYRSQDLTRLLDGIGQNIQVIKAADHGLQAISRILDEAESLVTEIQQTFPEEGILQPGEVRADEVTALSEIILASNPTAYWRLNDLGGSTAVNSGSGAGIDATYIGGPTLNQDPLYESGSSGSVDFSGAGQYVHVPDSGLINLSARSERTVELVFQADDVTSRQVLFEEGANVNDLSMYILNGRVYVTGRDQGAWGPVNISADIEVGETYHVAFVFDRPNDEFRGYLNGELIGTTSVNNTNFPSHSGDVAIGAMRQNAWFHDGQQGGTGLYFNGRISDVALYNNALTDADMADRYSAVAQIPVEGLNEEYETLISQIDLLVADSEYRGNNVLNGDSLRTYFNENRSSYLDIDGQNFTSASLGLEERPFIDPTDLEETLTRIREARDSVRQYSSSLANDLAIITGRETLTQSMINTLQEGRDSLTLADQNEVGARLLALQTRQQVQMSILSIQQASLFA